jgi:molybdenum cofactor cytidylyltransferase
MQRPIGILMAAGRGTRFGGGKLVHPVPPEGLPMAIVAYRHLKSAVGPVIVVVRPDDDAVHAAFAAEGVAPVVAQRAAEGMGLSLAAAIAASPPCPGWIVALGDMPSIQASTIVRIADALAAGASIAVPLHDGRRGHPVGFAARHRDALLALDGDTGARSVLAAHRAEVVEVPVDDAGIHADIDTREEAARLR